MQKLLYLDVTILNLDITILNLGVNNLNLGFRVVYVCVSVVLLLIIIIFLDVNVYQCLVIIISLAFCIAHKFHAQILLCTTLFVHYV